MKFSQFHIQEDVQACFHARTTNSGRAWTQEPKSWTKIEENGWKTRRMTFHQQREERFFCQVALCLCVLSLSLIYFDYHFLRRGLLFSFRCHCTTTMTCSCRPLPNWPRWLSLPRRRRSSKSPLNHQKPRLLWKVGFFICCRIYSCHLSPHDGQRVDEVPAGTIPAVQTSGQPTCTGCSFLQLGTQNSFSVVTERSFKNIIIFV